MEETTATPAPLPARRRRPRALVGLSFAAVSWAVASAADERQAAEGSTIRRPPVASRHDDAVAEVPGPDREESVPNNIRRNLAITDLFQRPSTRGHNHDNYVPDRKGPAENNDGGHRGTSIRGDGRDHDLEPRDVFGRDRTSIVAHGDASAADGDGDAEVIGPAYAGYLGGPSPYIVNGVNVPANRFPWFAAAMNSGSTFGGCAGVLIAQDWVLTAGHCVANGYNGADPPNIAYWEVGYMGAACLNQQNNCGQAYADVRHVETRVHPDYDWWTNSIYPDMALVRLQTPVTSIDPVEIDTGEYVGYGGQEAKLRGRRFTVIGAGWTVGQNRNSFPQYLQQVDVPFVPRDQCAAAYGDSPSSAHWRTELCAGAQNLDSCNGDSGGPLVIQEGYGGAAKYRLLATVSYGTPDCDGTPPGVYATVGNQISWIRSVVCDGYRDPSFCLNPPTPRPPTPRPPTPRPPTPRPPTPVPTPTPPEEDPRTSIAYEVRVLCDWERLTLYKRKGRRRGRPAIKESCIELSRRSRKNRSNICRKKRAAKRNCPQTCKGQCSAYFRTAD